MSLHSLVRYGADPVPGRFSLQEHLPQQTEEQRRSARHSEMRHDVVLIIHRGPLPVLFLDRFLQLLLVLLGHLVLREELGQRPGEALDRVRRPTVRRVLHDGG